MGSIDIGSIKVEKIEDELINQYIMEKKRNLVFNDTSFFLLMSQSSKFNCNFSIKSKEEIEEKIKIFLLIGNF